MDIFMLSPPDTVSENITEFVRLFVPKDLVTTIFHELIEQSWWNLQQIFSSPTDDLIRFWRSEVKVMTGCQGGEGIHVDASWTLSSSSETPFLSGYYLLLPHRIVSGLMWVCSRGCIMLFSYFMVQDTSAKMLQAGVFRTNCVDSLDRTNVVQSMLAMRVLQQQFVVSLFRFSCYLFSALQVIASSHHHHLYFIVCFPVELFSQCFPVFLPSVILRKNLWRWVARVFSVPGALFVT